MIEDFPNGGWKHNMVHPSWPLSSLFGYDIIVNTSQNMVHLILSLNFGVWALGLGFSQSWWYGSKHGRLDYSCSLQQMNMKHRVGFDILNF
jgi:hypothetical protein